MPCQIGGIDIHGGSQIYDFRSRKKVHVESHVLRYWEEELGLSIGRTEMGHRYYTEDDIQLFCCIKRLKDEGMLLRDLKLLIPQLNETRNRLRQADKVSEKTTAKSAVKALAGAATKQT